MGLALAFVAPPAQAQTSCAPGEVAIVADRDGTLYEEAAGGLANGAGDYLFAGTTATGEIRRGVLHFDVAAALPPGSTVLGVTLRLNMSRTTSGAAPVSLLPLLAAWGEGVSNAPDGEGGGTTPTAGDATWIHRYHPGSLWTAPGGDFAPLPSAATAVDAVGLYLWGSTSELIADVQGWLDAPADNHGWLLQGDESTGGSAKRFDARERGGTGPQLCVALTTPSTVEIPTLGAWGVAVLALALALLAAGRLARRPG